MEELQKAITVAKQQDITLLAENEYDCNTATGEETARLFAAIPDRRLMHNWDPCNIYEMGEQPFPKVWNLLNHSRIRPLYSYLKGCRPTSSNMEADWGGGEINLAQASFRALKGHKILGNLVS